MNRTSVWSVVAGLLFAGTLAADDRPMPVFQVVVEPDLSALQVALCLTPGMSERYALESRSQQQALGALSFEGEPLRARGRQLRLPAESEGCLRYAVDLTGLREDRRGGVMHLGRDVVVTPGTWLYAPVGESSYEIQFDLPEGVQVSAPWQPLDVSRSRYRVNPSPSGWAPVLAIGGFQQFEIGLPGGRLDVAVLDGRPAADLGEVRHWLEDAAGNVTLTYGQFPVPRVQVVVVPVAGFDAFGREAGREGGRGSDQSMPFARVLRRGGIAAQFFYNQTASLEEVLADWTATHEFSHLLLPYVRRTDGWLSEGFASYYQNVLRARSGQLDERTAWRKLHEGFERGRRDDYDDTLAESIRSRGPNMIMRMYWSGAAIALLADVELRRESAGRQSLDTVLAALQACCLPSARTWTAMEVFEKLDELSQTRVFAGLYQRWVDADQFPDVARVFDELGIETRRGRLRLAEAPDAGLRRAIMTAKTEPRH